MKRVILPLIVAVLLCSSRLSPADQPGRRRPHILNATYSLCWRIMRIEMDLADIAGNIGKARITATISVWLTPRQERLFELTELYRTASLISVRDQTAVRFKIYYYVPGDADIGAGEKVTGIGLVLRDGAGRRTPPLFREVELERPLES